jgi:hypothetical protein
VVWAWQPRNTAIKPAVSQAAAHSRSATSRPAAEPVQLRPEPERLADLGGDPAPIPSPDATPVDVAPLPADLVPAPALTKARRQPAAIPNRVMASASPRVPEKRKAAAPNPVASDRVATLTRISAGFFSQSMVHASEAKKTLLLAARNRSAARRKACHSDSCVADSYVREIRETGVIMEGRSGPAK